MSETATVAPQAPHRGGPPGRLVVGDHVGQAAAEAARAVRRAGLRPGMERSFGFDANLTGLVVAQEPSMGEELPRNAMVTLYVAAPEGTGTPGSGPEPDADRDTGAESLVHADTPPRVPSRRRPRKRRAQTGAGEHTRDPCPEPRLPAPRSFEGELQERPLASSGEQDRPAYRAAPQRHALEEAAVKDTDEHASHQPDVVHTDDVFAGRARDLRAWRRVYPRRQPRRVARAMVSWSREHRLLAATVCVILGAWIAAAAAGLAGPAVHGRRAGMARPTRARPPVQIPDAQRTSASREPRGRPPRTRRSGASSTLSRRSAPSRREAVRQASELELASKERGEPRLTMPKGPSGPSRPAPIAAPARRQTGGGPFSP